MKILHVMRHAQAESHGPRGDASRPLTPGGRRDAAEVGARLAGAGIQLALVSSAVRTRETFEAMALDCDGEFMDVLYRADVGEVLQRIGEVDEAVERLLVIGHSPTMPQLAAELVHASAPREADQLQCHFPTATLTSLQVEGPWAELGGHPVRLVEVNRP